MARHRAPVVKKILLDENLPVKQKNGPFSQNCLYFMLLLQSIVLVAGVSTAFVWYFRNQSGPVGTPPVAEEETFDISYMPSEPAYVPQPFKPNFPQPAKRDINREFEEGLLKLAGIVAQRDKARIIAESENNWRAQLARAEEQGPEAVAQVEVERARALRMLDSEATFDAGVRGLIGDTTYRAMRGAVQKRAKGENIKLA